MNRRTTQARWWTHVLEAGHDPLALRQREWLLTNGTGAFAAGTALGCPTRRYHGLLVAATRPPVGRIVALNQVWEELTLHREDDGATQDLTFNNLMFRGPDGGHVFAPRGFELLDRFERGLSVRWTYVWGGLTLVRELLLHWQAQAATLRYRVSGLDAAGCRGTLRLRPMVTMRDFHALLQARDAHLHEKSDGDTLRVYHGDTVMTLQLSAEGGAGKRTGVDAGSDARFEPNAHWWYGVHYPVELERGQDESEDYYVPGAMAVELPEAGEVEVALTAALGPEPVAPSKGSEKRARHLKPIAETIAPTDSEEDAGTARLLAIASDDFVVGRRIGDERLATIIAGYPWFADWGRDTFIALPGLLLSTGRHGEAKQVLRAFARSIHRGLVPNRFDDYKDEAAHYNTVDASLWFVRAALQYMEASEDVESWQGWLAAACVQILHAYYAGTDYGIHADEDGLIVAGSHETQLTWMDAATADTVFTPRPGKAVEVNALWHSGLVGVAETIETYGPPEASATEAGGAEDGEGDEMADPDALRKLAKRVQRAFNQTFWRDDLGYLLDHIWIDVNGQAHPDATLRPNQIFAAALPNGPIAQAKCKKVLTSVRDRLLTPVGLRTLPTDDPQYHGQYRGGQHQRDAAYHQGTIWAWLIGPYAEAVLRGGKFGHKARREAMEAITPLLNALADGGEASGDDAADRASTDHPHPALGSIGQLHEIYEADPMADGGYRPVGTFAQAWSVSEVLRIWTMAQDE